MTNLSLLTSSEGDSVTSINWNIREKTQHSALLCPTDVECLPFSQAGQMSGLSLCCRAPSIPPCLRKGAGISRSECTASPPPPAAPQSLQPRLWEQLPAAEPEAGRAIFFIDLMKIWQVHKGNSNNDGVKKENKPPAILQQN